MGAPCPAGDHTSRCGAAVLRPRFPVFVGRRAGELGPRRAGHDLTGLRRRLAASPLLPDPPLRALDLRRFGVGFEASFRRRRVAVHTGDLPPRQEVLLRARRHNGRALPRGSLAPRLLQPGGPPLRDADPALHPDLLLLVGPYARPSLPRRTAEG